MEVVFCGAGGAWGGRSRTCRCWTLSLLRLRDPRLRKLLLPAFDLLTSHHKQGFTLCTTVELTAGNIYPQHFGPPLRSSPTLSRAGTEISSSKGPPRPRPRHPRPPSVSHPTKAP